MIHDDKSGLNIFSNRVYEKIMEKMKEIGQTVTGLKRKVANWAKGVALQGNMNLENGYVHILCMTSISKLWQHVCLGSLIIIYMYLPLRYFKEGFPLVVTKYYTVSDLKDCHKVLYSKWFKRLTIFLLYINLCCRDMNCNTCCVCM